MDRPPPPPLDGSPPAKRVRLVEGGAGYATVAESALPPAAPRGAPAVVRPALLGGLPLGAVALSLIEDVLLMGDGVIRRHITMFASFIDIERLTHCSRALRDSLSCEETWGHFFYLLDPFATLGPRGVALALLNDSPVSARVLCSRLASNCCSTCSKAGAMLWDHASNVSVCGGVGAGGAGEE